MRRTALVGLLAAWACVAASAAAEDVVRFDFETGDLQGWQVVEGQFDYVVSDRPTSPQPVPGSARQPLQQAGAVLPVDRRAAAGQALERSHDRRDRVARVRAGRSRNVDARRLRHPAGHLRGPVHADGKEVLVARGKDQTEVMQRVRWDASAVVGQKVFLRVVDRETGGWGHVTLRRLHRPRPDRPEAHGDSLAVAETIALGAAAAADARSASATCRACAARSRI